MKAAPEGGLRFRFQPSLGPGEICAHLADAGLTNAGWKPLGKGPVHECLSDLVPVPGSKPVARTVSEDPEAGGDVTLPPTPSTLFFSARGRDEHAIDTIRFKLNLEDASVDRAGRAMLLDRLADLSRAIAWPVPDAITDAIRRQKRAVAERGGIRAEVLPEDGDIKRINVVLLLGTPATRLPSDRFVALPPIPKEMLKEDPDPRRAAPRMPAPPTPKAPATSPATATDDPSAAGPSRQGPPPPLSQPPLPPARPETITGAAGPGAPISTRTWMRFIDNPWSPSPPNSSLFASPGSLRSASWRARFRRESDCARNWSRLSSPPVR